MTQFVQSQLTHTGQSALIDLLNQGLNCQHEGQLDQAHGFYQQVLELAKPLEPPYSRALFLMGTLKLQDRKIDSAVQLLSRAMLLDPKLAPALRYLGHALNELGFSQEALTHYERALELEPDHQGTIEYKARTLTLLGRHQEAALAYHKLLNTNPARATIWFNLALALQQSGRISASIEAYKRAISIAPEYADAYKNLGVAFKSIGRMSEALACYDKAIALRPDFAETHYNRGNLLTELNRLEEAEASFREAIKHRPAYLAARSNLLFSLNYRSTLSAVDALEEAKRYGKIVEQPLEKQYRQATKREPRLPIRVGFVSGDLRQHPVGYFLEAIVRNINPSKLSLHAFVSDPSEDELTHRIKTSFDGWQTIAAQSDERAAQTIHDHGIDILIDLSGHSARNRLPVFAYKPAPVQCTWLGYFSTTGLSAIDYMIADPYVVPPEEECYYAEKVVRLPESYLCFTPPDYDILPGPLPAEQNGYITFGCFNNLSKLSTEVILLWSQLLQARPSARLFLKAKQLGDADLIAKLQQSFARHGVNPERLTIEGLTSREAYLKAYQRVDLGLDPFPWPGGTTTAEALWMAIPFITMEGDRFSSRNGQSIAINAGLPNWVANGPLDYLEKAKRFSDDRAGLAHLRSRLRSQVLKSPLFDAARFARNFETLMQSL